MSPQFQSIQRAALQLTPEEREQLAERLMISIAAPTDAGIEEAWFEAAEERYQSYKEGGSKVFEVKDVIASLKNRLG